MREASDYEPTSAGRRASAKGTRDILQNAYKGFRAIRREMKGRVAMPSGNTNRAGFG